MSPVLIVLGVVVLVGLAAVLVYNGVVTRRVRVKSDWAQIDVQLKRRHDLVPNLVAAVSGYMAHERGTLEGIARERERSIAAGDDVPARAAAEGALGGALAGLRARVEANPDLKASAGVSQLQEELATSENRIGFARQAYNDAVESYNAAIQRVPGNIAAALFRFRPEPFFELEDGAAAAAPVVALGSTVQTGSAPV